MLMTLLLAQAWIQTHRPSICVTCGADGTPGGRQDMAVCSEKTLTLERVRELCDAAPPARPSA